MSFLEVATQVSLLAAFQLPVRPAPGLEMYGPSFTLPACPAQAVEDSCKEEASESDVDNSNCSTADTSEQGSSPRGAVPGREHYEPGQALRNAAKITRKIDLESAILGHACGSAGSSGCPSVGSAGHHLGLCKPCDFMYRTNCRAGFSCKFCHLCPPGEIKKRKKQRKAMKDATVSLQQLMPWPMLPAAAASRAPAQVATGSMHPVSYCSHRQ
eukprot:TRINITY_DN13777_c0_g1_i1.p2 TRINITY_DN13777_c0_g1~~TRINITY_DN13777_c0_g1_i1.p2  ORF type:complete len:213 (-),score=56.44 TRINITY_DN13777_c0_g1_i1:48-686(-)